MWPFGGRFFPGTNLQDLNLDWLVQRVRDLSRGIIAPFINSANQHWMVWDTDAEIFVDSGVSAAGEGTGPQGEPGKSPIIGSNGNWYTWDPETQAYTDTGIRAQGPTGPTGPEGPAGPRTDNNLLVNWYFADPVNQRVAASWQNADEYTIDRWKLTAGSASLSAAGIYLNGTLSQTLEHAVNLPVTASALLSDGTMISPTFDAATRAFTVSAAGKTIVACKLEIGSIQTLAHLDSGAYILNDIPDYATEYAKCQRFLVRPLGGVVRWMNGQIATNIIDFCIPTPVNHPNRASVIDSGTLAVYSVDPATGAATVQDGFTFSVVAPGYETSAVTIRATKNSHGCAKAFLSASDTVLVSYE